MIERRRISRPPARGSRTNRGAIVLVVTLALPFAAPLAGQPPNAPPRPFQPQTLAPLPPPPGVLIYVPSKAGGERGIAVRVIAPPKARYAEGAPVVIHVAGGVGPGTAGGRPEMAAFGFVEIFFAFPGGGRGEDQSGGKYDFRGPDSIRALADVIRFATGRAADHQERDIDDVTGGMAVLKNNCGLIGSSHGGNACGMVMALHGAEFPDLAFYVSMESPYGEGAVNVELGGFETGLNPAYNAETGVLDLSRLAYSPLLTPTPFRGGAPAAAKLKGALYFDIDGNGKFSERADFPAHVFVGNAGQGLKAYYTPRLLREAERRALFGDSRPNHIPTLAETEQFWRYRDAAPSIPEAVRKCPDLAVIVYGNERDHVQIAPDHPHIVVQVEGFRQAGARFGRLNPDRSYVERVLETVGVPGPRRGRVFADNDAGKAFDRKTIRDGLEPPGLPPELYVQAAVCELADRTQAKNWTANLDAVLYPDAPWGAMGLPPPPGPAPAGPRSPGKLAPGPRPKAQQERQP